MGKLSRAKQAEVRAARRAKQQRQQRFKLMAVTGALAVAAVAVLIVAGNMLRDDNQTVRYASQAAGRVLGSADAPVTIDAWEDYQCPVCKAANATVLEQIDKQYIATGKAKLVFHNFPFIGPESQQAAEAADVAAEQDKFWAYHDALFEAQRAENSGAFSNDKLKALAVSAGLDSDAFNASFDSNKYESAVQAEKASGMQLGVDATPTFFVDGKRIADWRDYDAFAQAIEQALAQQAGTVG
jgi:protein-disulfide isomerase